jgi:thiol-disulfide isomerase/thioredoxin
MIYLCTFSHCSRVMLSLPLICIISVFTQVLHSQSPSVAKNNVQYHQSQTGTTQNIFSIRLHLNGTTTSLQQFRSLSTKCYVLVWFSPTCPICLKSLPVLQNLQSTYQNKGVKFILISPDSSLNSNEILEFKKSTNCTTPLLVDIKQELTSVLNAKVTPQAIVVDSIGTVVYSGKIDNLFERLGVQRRIVTKHYVKYAIESILNNTQLVERTTIPVGCIIERTK